MPQRDARSLPRRCFGAIPLPPPNKFHAKADNDLTPQCGGAAKRCPSSPCLSALPHSAASIGRWHWGPRSAFVVGAGLPSEHLGEKMAAHAMPYSESVWLSRGFDTNRPAMTGKWQQVLLNRMS
eukprot:13022162-Alexandrium_andersonii.AAC.1